MQPTFSFDSTALGRTVHIGDDAKHYYVSQCKYLIKLRYQRTDITVSPLGCTSFWTHPVTGNLAEVTVIIPEVQPVTGFARMEVQA
jgi:hypothetical protein